MIAPIALVVMLGVCPMKGMVADAAIGDVGFAEYVSIGNAPIIDGIRDEVWGQSTVLTTDEAESAVAGMVSVLWNETGLYFFAEIFDETTNASDRCNFWVSERFIPTDAGYYPDVDGAYYLCLTPDGVNEYWKSDEFGDKYDDMTGKYQVATSILEDGYTVELYVPLTGASDLKTNSSIGFNMSVDDYHVEGGSRVSFTYWNTYGYYWLHPGLLGEVVLTDNYMDNIDTPPTEDDNIDSTPDSSDEVEDSGTSSDSNSVSDSMVAENNETSSSGLLGCVSSLSGLTFIPVLAMGYLFIRKKR